MKILHTADWHVGRTIRNRPRDDEHRAVLAEITQIAAEESVDLVVVAGDVFDHVAPSPQSEEIVYRALLDLSGVAEHVVVVAGNHDHPARLRAVTPLLELGRIHLASTARKPGQGGQLSLPGIKIGLIPFVSKKGIVGVEELLSLHSDELRATYADRVVRIVTEICAGMDSDTVNLAVGHLMVAGSAPDGSERQAHLFEYAVPAMAFPSHLNYVALGHLHRQQRVPYPAPVYYSGSPIQLDFGEEEDRKGVLVVEVEQGLPAAVRPRELRSGRHLKTLSGTLEQIAARRDEVGDAYLRIELLEKARVGLADDVRELYPNAVDIRLAPTGSDKPPPTPSRIGRDPGELFREYLQSSGADDPALVALFDELHAETVEAEV